MTAVSKEQAGSFDTMAASMNADTVKAQQDEIQRLRGVIRKIAYEPFGSADASYAEVLALITNFAREALAK